MEYRLRIYTVAPGAMSTWMDEWSRLVRPLREKLGFEVLGAWADHDGDTFVWLLGYGRPDGYDAANARYYASPERAGLDPDPARHLTSTRELRVEPVA